MTRINVGAPEASRIHVGAVPVSRVHVGAELAWEAVTALNLGPPTGVNSLSTNMGVWWDLATGVRVPSSLIVNGADAYLYFASIRSAPAPSGTFTDIRLSSVSDPDPGTAGPEFISSVETDAILTFTTGSLSLVIDLADLVVDDITEPYKFLRSYGAIASWLTYISAVIALPATDRGTTLTIVAP